MPELQPWERLSQQLLLSLPPWLEVWRDTVRLPDGRVISDYYQVTAPDAVVAVARTDEGLVLAAYQYRHGARAAVWVLPAGFVNSGESPLAAAQRELLEETGYRADEWISLGIYVRDVNRGSGLVHMYLAIGARPAAQPDGLDLEGFRTQLLTLDDLIQAMSAAPVNGLGLVATVLTAKMYLARLAASDTAVHASTTDKEFKS